MLCAAQFSSEDASELRELLSSATRPKVRDLLSETLAAIERLGEDGGGGTTGRSGEVGGAVTEGECTAGSTDTKCGSATGPGREKMRKGADGGAGRGGGGEEGRGGEGGRGSQGERGGGAAWEEKGGRSGAGGEKERRRKKEKTPTCERSLHIFHMLPPAVEQTWHMEDSQGQIIAMSFLKVHNTFHFFPFRSAAVVFL